MRKTLLLTFFALIAFTAGAWAKGELNGVFTINAAGDRILFSKGNLQQVNGTWQFAEHQYDYFGTNQYSDHYDWFAYNGYSAPSDGTSWYILSQAEWAYLFESRTVTNTLSEGALYSKATIGGTYKGVIVFPDNYTHPNGTDFTGNCNNPTEAYSSTVSLEGWALMEAAGCVFLPAAGYSTSPGQVNQAAIYQSTTLPRSGYCNTPGFYIDYMAMTDESKTSTGVAVRYVKKYELTQDANGYYLLGSVQDWDDFAALINNGTNTAANAKMIADIDLGDDQTYISPTWHGDYSNRHYHGTFDGQGHTLTVHYSSSNAFHTPFSQTSGATIKNLHVAGTLTSTSSDATHMSGLISNSAGNDVIQNVWVSADITSGGSGWIECGAFIGCNNCGSSTITDCLFTGSLKTTSGYYNGCFVGYVHSGSTSTSNCLSTGTFELTGSPNYVAVGTVTNSYVKQHTGTIPSSMQVTTDQLADGTTTAALNNGRTGDDAVWVQQGSQPMLKTFALQQDADGYYEIGSVQDWKNFAEMVNNGTNTAANAKMTADIDLGDDQTYISPTWHGDNSPLHYHGTFDGQGHTLTVHYNSSNLFHTPFSQTSGATIKNLHVAGTITSTWSGAASHMSGLISNSAGSDVIQNVWVSVDISGGVGERLDWGAFVGCNNCGNTTITDCLFTGSITNTGTRNGCLAGLVYQGSVTTSNCLSTGTFNFDSSSSTVSVGTMTNCYIKTHPASIPSSMQVTDAQLSNGTTTAALQNGRSEEIWVQDPVTYQPVLKMFANDFNYTVPASGVGSFSSKAKVQLPDGLTAYYCKEYDSSKGIITAVPLDNNVIPANTGVLIRGEAGAYTLSATNATAATVEDNALVAVTEATHVDATSGQYTNFMLSSGKFIKIAASSDPNVKMPANKAYLQLALGFTTSKEFTLLWDEDPTAIKFESSEVLKSESIYDLQGRKVTNPEKGRLYIINGKVVKY
jgi:hypothetical protein